MEFLNDLMVQIYPLLTTALVIIIGAGVQALRTWLAGKTQNETALLAMDSFATITDAMVDQLAEAVKRETAATDDTPGVITPEEAAKIKADAVALLREMVPPNLKAVLESLVGDIEKWVDGMVVNSIRMRNIQYK